MSADDTSTTPPQPDTSDPSPARQADLRAAYDANIAAGAAPYAKVRIYTLGEVQWIQQERGWSTAMEVPDDQCINLSGANLSGATLSKAMLRGADLSMADLSFANLSGTNLSFATVNGAHLIEANLSEADLRRATLSKARIVGANLRKADLLAATLSDADLVRANLSGANLNRANLSGADLNEANLSEANLYMAVLSNANLSVANLSKADLVLANLSGANLRSATLNGADLRDATLRGADLREARLDTQTQLAGITLDTQTRLGDVFWSDATLTRVEWSQAPRLGDELAVREAKTRAERQRAYQAAARAYRGLAIALRAQGLLLPASGYRLREQRMERKAAWYGRRYSEWAFSALLDLIAGYGEAPERILLAYLIVVGAFAAVYWAVTHYLETKLARLAWNEALVLSLTSFHGRGFFPGSLPLGDIVAEVAAVEAVIGLFIELILIATFSRRFLGN